MFPFFARLVGGAVSPLVDQLATFGAGLLRKLALFLAAGVCLAVVLIALTLAFAFWIDSLAGPIVAALAVAAVYLVAAVGAVVAATRTGRPRQVAEPEPEEANDPAEPSTSARIDQFTAPILDILQRLGLRREQIAVLAGASLAKRLRPLPLVGLAIVAGFLIGRLWKGWDALMSTDLVATVLGLFGGGGNGDAEPGGAEPAGAEAKRAAT